MSGDQYYHFTNTQLVGGIPTPLKKIMEFVSWDDDIPLFPRYGKSLKDKTLFQSPPTRLLLTIINTY